MLERTTFLSHLIGISESLGRRIRICSLHEFCSLRAELKQCPQTAPRGDEKWKVTQGTARCQLRDPYSYRTTVGFVKVVAFKWPLKNDTGVGHKEEAGNGKNVRKG